MQGQSTLSTIQDRVMVRVTSEDARREIDQRRADEQFAAWVLGWGYSAGRVLREPADRDAQQDGKNAA